ncbi:PLD nuclease N-terminal domain-containing protein [Nocardiopsis ganjiahuensis]|uniref:PLD nuclease N-terminal domain-containing protein n=1 Tax=Nocardiopsis ganjiahuensis TaxID=239984 RepID=UPI00034CFA38|nr:PLD nuclease N-terminal domain-containing protein [Nocardiopsis ganjiahuensis]
MVYLALFLTVMSIAFWVYVLFDVVGSDAQRVRLLPKPAWAVIVLLLPKIGAALWFVLGRPPRDAALAGGPAGPPPPFPEYEHPGRARAVSPEEDEAFLRRCRERAEEQRRRAREFQEQETREHREREHGRQADRAAEGDTEAGGSEQRGPGSGPERERDGDEDPTGSAS